MNKYIAYLGDSFTIEWYWDENGKSSSLEYVKHLEEKDQRKLLQLLSHMGDIGEIRNKEKFRHEGDGIYAFKAQPHRYLCFFFSGRKIIITNAFEKKKQKLPKNEKDKALKARKSFQERTSKEVYYEK